MKIIYQLAQRLFITNIWNLTSRPTGSAANHKPTAILNFDKILKISVGSNMAICPTTGVHRCCRSIESYRLKFRTNCNPPAQVLKLISFERFFENRSTRWDSPLWKSFKSPRFRSVYQHWPINHNLDKTFPSSYLGAWLHEPAGLLRYAEMTFSARYYMRWASPVDGWCDIPLETGASLTLYSHWLNKLGWHGKRDYMEKSQSG